MADYYAPLDPDVLRRERARARELRASGWWKRRIADGICYYCRRRVGTGHLTMDHLVALARGGRSIRGNVVPACPECNVQKKTRLPVEWTEYLDTLRDAADE